MSEQKVDREAWARELSLLIEQESKGNKSAFARLTGLPSTRSIDRWLARSVNVSEESVRAIARALNLPVAELLLKVGFYTGRELPTTAEPAGRVEADLEALRTIEASDAPPSVKRDLREHLLAQRDAHERQRLEEVLRMLEIARRASGQAG